MLLFFIQFLAPVAHAQNLTGIWRGYFITEGYQQYKFELQIKHNSNFVSGVSYSYLNTVFYGKAKLTGSFSKKGQSALIQEIETVELTMSQGSTACIMKCIFKYERSGKEEFLEGTFTSKFEEDSKLNKKGDNCGGGKVFLRKVTTSDFYIEPFLRGKIKQAPVIVNKPPVKKDGGTTTGTSPQKKPVIVNQPPVKKPVTKDNNPVVKKADNDSSVTVSKPLPKVDRPVVPVPGILKTRSNELVKTLTVPDEKVIIKLYDNGEIDDDTISVYFNNKLVLSSQRLTASPLIIELELDTEREADNELIMVAENLGRIPPNTSLMIVESGGQRFDVRITSTEQKNAMVKLRYVKKKQ